MRPVLESVSMKKYLFVLVSVTFPDMTLPWAIRMAMPLFVAVPELENIRQGIDCPVRTVLVVDPLTALICENVFVKKLVGVKFAPTL